MIEKLHYGETQAQESGSARPHASGLRAKASTSICMACGGRGRIRAAQRLSFPRKRTVQGSGFATVPGLQRTIRFAHAALRPGHPRWLLLSLWLRSATSCIALTPPSAQHPSFPRRLFRPGYDHSFLLPHDGSEAPRGARVQRHPQKHAVTPRAQALARRLASRPRDTASLGAPPWRFSAGVRASFAGISSGSVQRAPRSQVVVPGGRGPGPPEATVASRRRRTPLPAPPSGSPPEGARR